MRKATTTTTTTTTTMFQTTAWMAAMVTGLGLELCTRPRLKFRTQTR